MTTIRMTATAVAFAMLVATLAACEPSAPATSRQPAREAQSSPAPHPSPLAPDVRAVVEAARARTLANESYDPTYYSIAYPGGDVPDDRGVCTDVVVRAYRHIGIDFQVLVHEDMRTDFSAYPRIWGLRAPDRNIDHRRVPNLQTYLERQGASRPISSSPADYPAGDLVTWMLPGNLPHIGIVSDRKVAGGDRPLVLHNIGWGTSEDDILMSYPITGHYRFYPEVR